MRCAQVDKTLNGNKYRAASLEKWIDQLSAWVEKRGPLPEESVLVKLSNKGLQEGVNKNKTAPEHPAYAAFDRLIGQLSDLNLTSALLNHAAQDIGRRFRQAKHRRAQMGFDDLLTMLQKALQSPGGRQLGAVIRTQFPVVLIDEFQDTDPVQYEIFRKVYLDQPETALLMIGDPKQAIYAFRGADIHTYLAARNDTGTAITPWTRTTARPKPWWLPSTRYSLRRPNTPKGPFVRRPDPVSQSRGPEWKGRVDG